MRNTFVPENPFKHSTCSFHSWFCK